MDTVQTIIKLLISDVVNKSIQVLPKKWHKAVMIFHNDDNSMVRKYKQSQQLFRESYIKISAATVVSQRFTNIVLHGSHNSFIITVFS